MYRECWECPKRACFMAAALPLPFLQPLQAIHVACYLLPAFYLPYHAPWPCSKCPNCKPERWKPLFQERWEGIIIAWIHVCERIQVLWPSVVTKSVSWPVTCCAASTSNTMFSNMGFTFQFSHDFFWDICVCWCGKMRNGQDPSFGGEVSQGVKLNVPGEQKKVGADTKWPSSWGRQLQLLIFCYFLASYGQKTGW